MMRLSVVWRGESKQGADALAYPLSSIDTQSLRESHLNRCPSRITHRAVIRQQPALDQRAAAGGLNLKPISRIGTPGNQIILIAWDRTQRQSIIQRRGS